MRLCVNAGEVRDLGLPCALQSSVPVSESKPPLSAKQKAAAKLARSNKMTSIKIKTEEQAASSAAPASSSKAQASATGHPDSGTHAASLDPKPLITLPLTQLTNVTLAAASASVHRGGIDN